VGDKATCASKDHRLVSGAAGLRDCPAENMCLVKMCGKEGVCLCDMKINQADKFTAAHDEVWISYVV